MNEPFRRLSYEEYLLTVRPSPQERLNAIKARADIMKYIESKGIHVVIGPETEDTECWTLRISKNGSTAFVDWGISVMSLVDGNTQQSRADRHIAKLESLIAEEP